MFNVLFNQFKLKKYLFILNTVFVVTLIEVARRFEVKMPLPFLLLFISVITAGWKGGRVPGIISGLFASAYIYYESINGFLSATMPTMEQAALLGILIFAGSGYLFAYIKSQHINLLEETKQHAVQLNQKEEVYRVLAEASEDLITRFDREYRQIYVNPAVFKLTGKLPDEHVGKTIKELKLPPELSNKFENSIETVFTTGEPNSIIFETQGLDGSTRTIDWRAYPEFDSSGKVASVIRIARDITERRHSEIEQQKIRHLDSLGVLAGGIAHDFNNLLTVLFGNISLIRHTLPAGHKGLEYVEKAEEAIERTTHLSSQLLEYAKEGVPKKENISLDKIIEEVTIFDLSGSKVKFIFEAEEGLWLADVDKGQMGQVFSNLATNAKQAMTNGGHYYISIENVDFKRRTRDSKGGKYLKIIVKDEGTGIEKENLDRVFDPYFSTKDTGNGLGLATTYSIVVKHNGYISVDSNLGQGTTFTIYLPAFQAEQSLEKNLEKRPLNEEVLRTIQSSRILILDDDKTICELARTILEQQGCIVETASTGQQTVYIYKKAMKNKQPFDCIIMDLTIPGEGGGKEVVKEILKADSSANVIITSGYTVDPVMENYEEYGFKGVVSKPFTGSSLVGQVERVVCGVVH